MERVGSIRRTIIGIFAIIIGIMVCTVVSVVAMDAYCSSDIEHWLPVYPGAEERVAETEHDFFRPRGMGRTSMVFYTPDDTVTVRRWYTEYRREITKGAYSENSEQALRGVANVSYQIIEEPDGGTLIYLNSECAYN